MAMMKCPHCQMDMPEGAYRCGHCGRGVNTHPFTFVVALILGLLLVGIIWTVYKQ